MDYNATKGGVDTVDKMCSTYSISRITRRWPCAVFFSLMNIAGINAQVLYSFANQSNIKLQRRQFLKNLSLSLMNEHLKTRASLYNLPSDIQAFLKINYGLPNEQDRDKQPPSKRGTCRLCVQERKRTSASMKCDNCQTFTCKRHSKKQTVCFSCANESNSD